MDHINTGSIDVVITWVDGNDQKLTQKRQQYLSKDTASDASSTTRFASNDEIYFCVASILKYFPECGNIYIVTDQQKPQFIDDFAKENLCASDKIQIIDHQVLFTGYTQHLPVFNSLSIETLLWNIPHLSNEFIYFNDDIFLNAYLAKEDCFIADKVVIYGHWQSNTLLKTKYLFRKLLNKWFGKTLEPRFTIAQMLSADLIGMPQHYVLDHRPHFLQVKVLRDYFEANLEILNRQISYKFRDFEQFLPMGLANHLAVKHDQAILREDVSVAYIKPNDDTAKFEQQLKQEDIQYGCIQSLDQMSAEDQHLIHKLMINKLFDYLPKVIKGM